MEILLSPISLGSGVPIKITDSLNLGKLVITTEFGARDFNEFIGSCVFTLKNGQIALDELLMNQYKMRKGLRLIIYLQVKIMKLLIVFFPLFNIQ